MRIGGVLPFAADPESVSGENRAGAAEQDHSIDRGRRQRRTDDKDRACGRRAVRGVGHGFRTGERLRTTLVPHAVAAGTGARAVELHQDCRDGPLLLLQKHAFHHPAVHLRVLLGLFRPDHIR